jgi:hypothetical protein
MRPPAATDVEPYMRADGARIWSLLQLEQQLRPEGVRPAPGRRRRPPTDPDGRCMAKPTLVD